MAILSKEAPTRDEILAMRDDRKSIYAKYHAELEMDEDFDRWSSTKEGRAIAMKYLEGFPKGYVPKVLPLATLGVESGLNSIFVGETPLVDIDMPQGSHRKDEREREHEEEIENWCRAWMHRVDTMQMSSVFRDLLRKQIVCGMGVLYYPPQWDLYPDPPDKSKHLDKDAWERYEREKANCFPWSGIRSVHPRNCYPDPDNDLPQDLIIEEDVSLAAMLKAYPHLKENPKFTGRAAGRLTGSERTSKRLIYCSASYYAVFIDEIPALTEKEDGANKEGVAPNPTRRPWFRVVDGGFGDADHRGRPEYRFKGRIRDTRDIIIRLMTDINIIERVRMFAAFPPLLVRGQMPDASDADKVAKQYTYGPGIVQAIPPGITFEKPPVHEVPPDVFRDLQESKSQYQMAYGVDPLTGQYRDEPASGLRTRLAQARAPYRTPKRNAEQAIAGMLEDILLGQLPELDGPVLVESLKLSRPVPDGIVIHVDLSPPTEEELQARREVAKQLLELGVSHRTVLSEQLDIDDPKAEMVQRAIEDIGKQGPIIESIVRTVIGQYQRFLMERRPDLAAALGMEDTMPQATNLQNPGQGGQQVQEQPQEFVPQPGLGGVQQPGMQQAPAPVGGAAEVQQAAQQMAGAR